MMPRILSFGAHPDDCELGCGGTELLAIEHGYEVFHAVVTSGEAGGRGMEPQALASIREAEARAAAKLIGVTECFFLRLADGLTSFSSDEKIRVINLIRAVRPEIVFLHASSDQHPDHKVVRELVLSALGGAAGPWYPLATGEPWGVAHVYGYEVWNPINAPQLTVNISSVLAKKLESLQCFASQMESIAYDQAAEGLAKYRGSLTQNGTHAEAFEILRSTLPF